MNIGDDDDDEVIVWETHNDLQICDIHPKRRSAIAEFMLNNYFKPNHIFCKLGYQNDEVSHKEYLNYVNHILAGECCILVENPRTQEVKAVVLARYMNRKWFSWTDLTLWVGESKFAEIIDLKYRMIKKFSLKHPEHPYNSMHIFECYLDEYLREDAEFLRKLVKSVSDVATCMKIHRLTFISLSQDEYNDAIRTGLHSLSTTYYTLYMVKENRPFAMLRDIDEMRAVIFEMYLQPRIPYYEMEIKDIEDIMAERQEREEAERWYERSSG